MRILFFCSLLIFFIHPVIAQTFSGGLTAKAGISQILRASKFGQPSGYDYTNKFRFSYQLGVYGAMKLSPRSSIGVELLYLRQNGLLETNINYLDTFSGTLVIGQDKLYMYLDYFSVPLYYVFSTANVSLHLGVQGNVVISQKGKDLFVAKVNGDSTNSETEFDSLNFKSYDAGLTAGVRYQPGKKVFFGFDYYLGFVNLSNDEAIFSAQNQNFSFSVGYLLFTGSSRREREQWYTK
jgi:hypothetical protein